LPDPSDDLLAWLRGALPAGCAAAASPVSTSAPDLFEEEAALLRHAREGRRREFQAGRAAARAALNALGVPPGPILVHRAGYPAWPDGFVGSITHTRTLAIAVVGPIASVSSLGIDLEDDSPLDADLRPLIRRTDEAEGRDDFPARGLDADKLRFVAKEAFYKALFPLRGRFLEFTDVTVTLAARQDRFVARVADPGDKGTALCGAFTHRQGCILAVVAAPPAAIG
jgi:4'-phosphopantetheinyl transferase EntD